MLDNQIIRHSVHWHLRNFFLYLIFTYSLEFYFPRGETSRTAIQMKAPVALTRYNDFSGTLLYCNNSSGGQWAEACQFSDEKKSSGYSHKRLFGVTNDDDDDKAW